MNMKKKFVAVVCILLILLFLGYFGYNLFKQKENYAEDILIAEVINSDEDVDLTKVISDLRKNVNNEIVGWLKISDTKVNYPVLKRDDNDYYINHNYKGEETNSGAIFLDKAVDLDLPSSNFLIYGHNNLDGSGDFAPLLDYRDLEFYNTHKRIIFATDKEKMEFEIISVFYSKVYYKSQKNVFRYYYFINAQTEEEYDSFVQNAKNASIFDIETTARYGEQLLTLSTCEYSKENGRFVIVAKKINN